MKVKRFTTNNETNVKAELILPKLDLFITITTKEKKYEIKVKYDYNTNSVFQFGTNLGMLNQAGINQGIELEEEIGSIFTYDDSIYCNARLTININKNDIAEIKCECIEFKNSSDFWSVNIPSQVFFIPILHALELDDYCRGKEHHKYNENTYIIEATNNNKADKWAKLRNEIMNDHYPIG